MVERQELATANEIIQPAWKQADLSDQYNTELNPEQESAYQNWLSIQKVPTSTRDYDLKGFFANQVFGNTDNSEHEGHFDDRWKKPNHMTFSDQSNYAQILPDGSSTGGRWEQRLSPEDDPKGLGIWHFIRPIHGRIPDEPFREYYEREEPGNTWELSSISMRKQITNDHKNCRNY